MSADGKDYTYYEGTASGDTIGYVFKTSAKGYGGDIDLMVGIDTSGKVTGVSILSISETAGLGMNAKNESFIKSVHRKIRYDRRFQKTARPIPKFKLLLELR